MERKRLDLTGQIIGFWKVGERVIGNDGRSYFKCACLNCGNTQTVRGSSLKAGDTKSCGCMVYDEKTIEKRTKTLHKKKILAEGTSVALISKIYGGELMKNNTSGRTGVYKKGNRWFAEIVFQGVRHYLGSYPNFEDAAEARSTAEELYFGNTLRNLEDNHR